MNGSWIRRSAAVLVALALASAAPGAPGAQSDQPVQHGAQPNPGEVRPPSPHGNVPSPSSGTLIPDRTPDQVFGVPAGLMIALAALALLVAALWLYARRFRGRLRPGTRGEHPSRR